MIIKSGIESDDIISLPKDSIDRIKKDAQVFSQGDVFYIINVISNGLKMIKQLLPERIVFELTMVRLTSRDSIASIEEILSRLRDAGAKNISEAQKPQTVQPDAHRSEIKPAREEKTFFKKILNVQASAKKEESAGPAQGNPLQASIDINRVKDAWPILVKAMAVKKMSISTYLAEGEPDSVKGDTVIIGFPKELNFSQGGARGKTQ